MFNQGQLRNDGDNIYYYLNITNYDKSSNTEPPQLSFVDTRTMPILADASQYFVAVQKLYIETNWIPFFIPIIETPVLNINKTIYSFTMSKVVGLNTVEHQEYLIYEPQNTTVVPPQVGTATQQLNNTYYYVYQVQHFTKLLNKTLKNCYDNLSAKIVLAGGAPLGAGGQPKLEFNIDNSKFVLFADKSQFDESLVNPVKLFMNSNMNHLLSNFQCEYLGYSGITNGKNVRLQIYSTGFNEYLGPITYIQMYQEISGISLMNSCGGIVLSTNLLPIRSSLTGREQLFGGTFEQTSNNNSNTLAMITDFTIGSESIDNSYRPFILYQPSPNYKWLDLLSNNSINNININVYFRDNFNRLAPVYLPSGSTAQITLLFRSKNYPSIS
jgi:hypothetical protein